MPFIPVVPSQFHVESVRHTSLKGCFCLATFFFFKEKRSALDEYTITSRALVRWIKDSIFTMENKNVPKNLNEIRTLLADVRSFKLDEYALRLKEKKNILKLYSDLNVCCL